jgi:hypothetical protein
MTVGLVLTLALVGSVPQARAESARYTVDRMPDGGIRFAGDSAALKFSKTSYADGHFTFEIVSGNDRVDIRLSKLGLHVARGAARIDFTADGLGAIDLRRVRAALAGSKAIAQYHTLAASLSNDRSTAAYGVRLGNAILGQFLGEGQPATSGGLIAATKMPASPLSERRFQFVRTSDCWGSYENEVTRAQNDLVSCTIGATMSFWPDLYLTGCQLEWAVRVEGYWFEYLSCEAVPLRAA